MNRDLTEACIKTAARVTHRSARHRSVSSSQIKRIVSSFPRRLEKRLELVPCVADERRPSAKARRFCKGLLLPGVTPANTIPARDAMIQFVSLLICQM